MITEHTYCTRCGKELRLDDTLDYESEDYGKTYILVCDHCGAVYECTEVSEKDKSDYEFYDDEESNVELRREEPDLLNGYCTNCGHKVSMANNFMLSDYDDSIKDENDDKMNFILNQCPFCGMYEVRWDTAENEKSKYPYWKEEEE